MEEISVAISSVLSHKLRSLLTMLGIIIGIGAIIAIFSIIEGNTEMMKRRLTGGINNTITVGYHQKSSIDTTIPVKENPQRPLYIPFTGEESLHHIKQIDGVKNAYLAYTSDTSLFYLSKKANAKVSAVTANVGEIRPIKMVAGEGFSSVAFLEGKQVILLEKSLYEGLFPNNDGLGKYIEIKGNPFKIIGVYEEKSSITNGANKTAFLPLAQWYRLYDEMNPSPEVVIQTQSADQLKEVSQRVGAFLNNHVPSSDFQFGVMDLRDFEQQLDNLNRSNFVLLAGIASISLIVGGIGVMNIMLVSVTERTREIGIKKALGARRRVILKQFLIEAIILTLMGGLLGVLGGILAGFIITTSLSYPYILSILSIVVSLLFCCIIGIVFGLLPAIKASRLNPIEALRFE